MFQIKSCWSCERITVLLTIALHRLKIKQFGCLNLLQQIVTFCRICTLPMFHLFLGCVMTQATSWGDPCFRINLKSSMNSGRMYTLPGDFPLRTCTVGVLSCTDPSKNKSPFRPRRRHAASPALHAIAEVSHTMKNIREPATWRTCSSQSPHHRLFKASAFTMTMG